MITIENKNSKFIWEVDLKQYPEKTSLKVDYNTRALCISEENPDGANYNEGDVIEINRKHGRKVRVLAVSGESLDLAWGCSGVNTTNSYKPKYTLGMSGNLTLRVTNLNVFHRGFQGIYTEDKKAVESAIWEKLHVDISKAAERALKLVVSTYGNNPDNEILQREAIDQVQNVFTRYGLELLTLSIIGGVHVFEEERPDNGGDFGSQIEKTLGTGKNATEDVQVKREAKKLETQRACPRCGCIFTGNPQNCPNCNLTLKKSDFQINNNTNNI